VLVEIRGTVGDIEVLPFFERFPPALERIARDHAVYIHLRCCRSFRAPAN